MAIVYECRHCRQEIGRISQLEIDAKHLGFQMLSSEERIEMIHYESDGNVRVKIICEDCQEALERNPFYHQLDDFIQ